MNTHAHSGAVVFLSTVSLLAIAVWLDAGEGSVRPPGVAGAFYTSDSDALRKQVDAYLAEGVKKANVEGKPIALVVPHAGYDYSGRCAGVAYAAVKGKGYKRVVVLAFSHRGMIPASGSILRVDAYRTPLGDVPLDRAACDTLLKSERFGSFPAADRFEHSLEVQLPFLQRALGTFQLVPILLGRLEEEDYAPTAAEIRKVVDQDTLLVASSDFTHYGERFDFAPFRTDVRQNIEKLDKGAIDFILKLDGPGFTGYLRRTGATICGRDPIRVLIHLLPKGAKGQLLDYYTSGDEAGDYRHSVSYAAIAFTAPAGAATSSPPKAAEEKPPEPAPETSGDRISPAGQKKLLEIARKTLISVAEGKGVPEFKLDDPELQSRNGVFVTLHKKGELRGCIGNFRPQTPLYQTVAIQTEHSALHDQRFPAVRPIEVEDIDIEISVLLPERPIKDPLDWELGKHGIIVRRGWQQATFLPQVAEHFKSKEEMLSACCRKAGMLSNMWRDPGTTVLIYEAQVFGEKPREKAK